MDGPATGTPVLAAFGGGPSSGGAKEAAAPTKNPSAPPPKPPRPAMHAGRAAIHASSPTSSSSSSSSSSPSKSWRRVGAIFAIVCFGAYVLRGSLDVTIHNDPVVRETEITVKAGFSKNGKPLTPATPEDEPAASTPQPPSPRSLPINEPSSATATTALAVITAGTAPAAATVADSIDKVSANVTTVGNNVSSSIGVVPGSEKSHAGQGKNGTGAGPGRGKHKKGATDSSQKGKKSGGHGGHQAHSGVPGLPGSSAKGLKGGTKPRVHMLSSAPATSKADNSSQGGESGSGSGGSGHHHRHSGEGGGGEGGGGGGHHHHHHHQKFAGEKVAREVHNGAVSKTSSKISSKPLSKEKESSAEMQQLLERERALQDHIRDMESKLSKLQPSGRADSPEQAPAPPHPALQGQPMSPPKEVPGKTAPTTAALLPVVSTLNTTAVAAGDAASPATSSVPPSAASLLPLHERPHSGPAPHAAFGSGVTLAHDHEHGNLTEKGGKSLMASSNKAKGSSGEGATESSTTTKEDEKYSQPWRDYTKTLERTNLQGAHAHSNVHLLDGLSITWEPDPNATDWLEVLGATKYDVKKQCTYPPQKDAAPAKPPIKLGAHTSGPRIAWFFTLNYAPTQAYADMVKSLVLSGRIKAPNLEPHFLYVLTPKQYAEYERKGKKPDELEKWMAGLGVNVIIHVVSFAHRPGMEKAVHAQWARLDLLPLIRDLRDDFKKQGLLSTHVLYTDMDIFFSKAIPLPGTRAYGDLTSCGEAHPFGSKKKVAGSHCPWGGHGKQVQDPNWPYVFGAGTEVFSGWGLNSGVMYINIENSSKYFSHLVEHCTKKTFHRWPAQDQSCIEDFFSAPDDAVGWDWLDDAVINSRGFLDPNRFLTGGQGSASRSAVWHWHGYKANQIQCLFHAIKDGTWNVDNGPGFSSRRGGLKNPSDKGPLAKEVPGCKIIQGRFKFTLYGCYLSTYAWMLIQHERWLHMAKTARFVHD